MWNMQGWENASQHTEQQPGVMLAFFKMRPAYAHLTKKCVRAAKMCVSVYYRSNYHLGQKHEQQQQIQARVQTYSLNPSFPAIAPFVELNSTWIGFRCFAYALRELTYLLTYAHRSQWSIGHQ